MLFRQSSSTPRRTSRPSRPTPAPAAPPPPEMQCWLRRDGHLRGLSEIKYHPRAPAVASAGNIALWGCGGQVSGDSPMCAEWYFISQTPGSSLPWGERAMPGPDACAACPRSEWLKMWCPAAMNLPEGECRKLGRCQKNSGRCPAPHPSCACVPAPWPPPSA